MMFFKSSGLGRTADLIIFLLFDPVHVISDVGKLRHARGSCELLTEQEAAVKNGALIRSFERNTENLDSRVEEESETIRQALNLACDGVKFFDLVTVLVWADQRYNSDFGGTAEALSEEWSEEDRVEVVEVNHGDLYCGILNRGVAEQYRRGIDWSMVWSSEARSYMNDQTIEAIQSAQNHSESRAVGVAIDELRQSILQGRLANTLCLWHNQSLLTVGGFDLVAARHVSDKEGVFLKGFDDEDGFLSVPHRGTEEMLPLARMVETFGPCIIPVTPKDVEGEYEVSAGADREEWHRQKIRDKRDRQDANLLHGGFAPSYLRGGVIEVM